ncbi:hypothetical protein HGA91_00570 [candidate division WWE3 bacterium]|nr:hypothetical protein [candidate division WWE3 bacterium]
MKGKSRYFILSIATGVFLVAIIIFQVMHTQADTTPIALPPEQLLPFDGALRTDFFTQLEERKANQLGTDLGY